MTTTTINTISERSAVAKASTFDRTLPDYLHSIDIALARRGTRDALLVSVCKTQSWDKITATFPYITSDNPEVRENMIATRAIAKWIEGDTEEALRLSAMHPEHYMCSLVHTLIVQDITPERWIGIIENIDLDTCYSFED